jgi:TonB family protein
MDCMFARVPPRRRSSVGVVFSAIAHLAVAFGGVWVVEVGAFEPPRAGPTSITFVVPVSMIPEVVLRSDPPIAATPDPVAAAPAEQPLPEAEPTPVATSTAVETPATVDVPHVGTTLADAVIPAPTIVAAPPPPVRVAPVVSVGGFGAVKGEYGLRAGATGGVTVGQLQNARAAASPQRTGGDAVRSAEFDVKTEPRPVSPAAPVVEAPIEVPVTIVSKPVPDYTDEARALRIEGDVILEVEFSATEEIRVLRVVRGLGHGLDDNAARAASRIRFKPAQRGGQPVGVRTLVHIVFRLA